jgi:hypothetical protein
VTTGVLNLADARAKLDRARELHAEVDLALAEWQSTGGVEAQVRPHHELAYYTGYAKVNSESPINIPLRAGEVLHALRTALDYTAFQIHLVGGGTPDGKDARGVAFPIVTDASKWESSVSSNVRNAWPAAVAELKAVQQFEPPQQNPSSPLPPIDPLLSRLATLGGTDKHRNLSLFATGAWAQNAFRPEMQGEHMVEIRIYQPGPLLPKVPGEKVAVSQVLLKPGASAGAHRDDVFAWQPGIEFTRPDPPELSFGFRANDGTEISVRELPGAIELVESILDRFAVLTAP